MMAPLAWLRGRFNRDTAIVVGALALGGVALFIADRYLEHQEERFRATLTRQHETGTTQVVVAKADYPAGTEVSESTMAVRAIPSDYVHAEAVRPDRFNEVRGRHLGQALQQGRTLLFSYVAEGPSGFSDTITPGQRALTLHVDEVSSINGLVRPGDRLDLMYTRRDSGSPVVRPLLSAVKVLATGALVDATPAQDPRRAAGLARSYSTITLEVSPQDAEQVILARESGQVTAMLRRRAVDDAASAPQPVRASAPAERAQRLPASRVTADGARKPPQERAVDYVMGGRGNGMPEYVRVPLDMAAHLARGGVPPQVQLPPVPASALAGSLAPAAPVASPATIPGSPVAAAVPASPDARAYPVHQEPPQ